MILLVNTFITNQSSTGGAWEATGVKQDRGNLNKDNKVDVLKYTLASFAKFYPWKRAIIKVQLDTDYYSNEVENELELFIKEEFKDIDLYFSNKRIVTQQEWKEVYELINDDLIHVYCSHDHVILDSSSEYFSKMIDSIRKNYIDDYVTVAFSHWSEFIRNAKCGPTNTHRDNPPTFYNEEYKIEDNYVSFKGHCYDSIHIYSKKLFEDFFIKGNWNDVLKFYPPNIFKSGQLELTRIDGVGITDLNFIRNKILNIPTPKQRIIIPYKEIARHYDGYFYHGITNEQVPSIEIPNGFFENNIKIRYGYNDRKEGWTNINPKSDHYYAADKSGVDYKLTLKELPLFWKNRISEIDINPNIDEMEMIQYRLKAVLEMVYTSPNHPIDKELEFKILNEYLTQYPEYQLDEN
jgi:hypothetical protein